MRGNNGERQWRWGFKCEELAGNGGLGFCVWVVMGGSWGRDGRRGNLLPLLFFFFLYFYVMFFLFNIFFVKPYKHSINKINGIS
ncbi:hypothetical protein LguiA_024756 [Lonicera macranthoides]